MVEPLLACLQCLTHRTPEQIATEVLSQGQPLDVKGAVHSSSVCEANGSGPKPSPIAMELELF